MAVTILRTTPDYRNCSCTVEEHANSHRDSLARAWEDCAAGELGLVGVVYDGFQKVYKHMFEGFVLGEREHNGYHDSDFYAVVWNPFTGRTDTYVFGTTRAWTYENGCSVDATPEVLEAHADWQRKVRESAEKARMASYRARTDIKGRTVRVVKGRKVRNGLVGEVRWVGRCGYTGKTRIGIAADGTMNFVLADYCEVVSLRKDEE